MLRTRPQRRSATALRRAAEGESSRTILIALFANIVIGIAKFFGGLVSGSSGMLAEAAHSAADSVNEIFLAVGIFHGRDRVILDWRLSVHRDGHCRAEGKPPAVSQSCCVDRFGRCVHRGRNILAAGHAPGAPPS